ncbi:MAG TPA: DegT/DnrJ/EryC1/StrS family aminotransferase, partial [Solirubrobacteraceae bacterium]|nr:DegT/DnrJ/EryC1/StrS family aminotransferase [Solirubrobacteraceae bacterium]
MTPVLGRPDATDAPAPPGEPAWVTVAQPAAAWELGLTAAGLRPGHVVLVPALHDAGRLAPFAARGLVLRAYDLDDAFRPDPGSLETAAAGARALLLAHQLGFPADAPRWRAWCEGRGLLLLEDAIDGWATSDRGVPAGSSGHVAVVGLAPPESGSGAVAVRA